jgi:hypothetical protein
MPGAQTGLAVLQLKYLLKGLPGQCQFIETPARDVQVQSRASGSGKLANQSVQRSAIDGSGAAETLTRSRNKPGTIPEQRTNDMRLRSRGNERAMRLHLLGL